MVPSSPVLVIRPLRVMSSGIGGGVRKGEGVIWGLMMSFCLAKFSSSVLLLNSS